MASTISSDKPNLPAPSEDNDPFVSSKTAPSHYRYSSFDQDLFAAGPGSSPRQAKRALESHLAETERRLDEAGKLGTALVAQRKALSEQLQEVDKWQAEGELKPELRQKLVDIEKEFNDLSRESARAFLPKSRVSSSETNPGSPYVPEGRSGRRSVSPSKFESQATGSPTKLTVPNRKTRNQPSNRVHDIEFAAEISTSLIAQVRNLQGVLAEREEDVRELQSEKQRLEIDAENFQQRLKTLDESEQRYKEENWNLETRIQEINSLQKESLDKEKKLTQALNVSKAGHTSAQKELDEIKVSHSRLTEEHAAATKHHDIELGTAKRGAAAAETERVTMQKRIDELTSQNQELAKAFSAQRGRIVERDPTFAVSDEDFESAADHVTPEHSPPPSPVKGTPRHSVLETETMKTSLHHAQRTIQSQRSQLHREKTEKIELRRIVQELREDLERSRGDGNASNRRSRKAESKEFKKPPHLLGNFRSSRQEVLMGDPEWEEHDGTSPRTPSARTGTFSGSIAEHPTDSSDHFDTANEAGESAFETANERATETDDFQTGNEALSDEDEDAQTETEGNSRGFGMLKKTPVLTAGGRGPRRGSFHSTASTSADDEDYTITELKTPAGSRISSQRTAFRTGGFSPFSRSSRQVSEEPSLRDSPASLASFATSSQQDTPQAGQSLFAELQDFGSDEESLGRMTPSRKSIRSRQGTVSPPPAMPAMPKLVMVDSAVMTDPVTIATTSSVDASDKDSGPLSVPHTAGDRNSWVSSRGAASSRPLSTASYSDAGAQYETDMDGKLAMFPVPPVSMPSPPTLEYSNIQTEHVEPQAELPPAMPALQFTQHISEHTPPVAEPAVVPPTLSLSPYATHILEPIAEPAIVPPTLSLSPFATHNLEPVAEPAVPLPALTMASLSTQMVEPVADPEVPLPTLTLSNIHGEHSAPIAEIEVPAPLLSYSSVFGEHVHPVAEAEPNTPRAIAPVEIPQPEPVSLSMTPMSVQHVEPRLEPTLPPPTLAYSVISAENVQPLASPEPPLPSLAMTPIAIQHTRPVSMAGPRLPSLTISSVASETVEPISIPEVRPQTPAFGFVPISAIETLPVTPRSPRRDGFILPREADRDLPETPKPTLFGSIMPRGKGAQTETIIAEDETRQSPPDSSAEGGTPESQRPFKEISSNATARMPRNQGFKTSDQGAQTALTAEQIDKILLPGSARKGHQKSLSQSSAGSPDTTGTVRIRRRSQDSTGSPVRASKGMMLDEVALETGSTKRPGSSASARGSIQDAPPLPQNHKQIIEAARTSSSHGQPAGTMGPPLWPASALKARPQTPSQRPISASSAQGTPTPRAARTGPTGGRADIYPPQSRMPARSRQSSVSSFASELDSRFGIRPGEMGMGPTGFGPNTDPRMIQAITQTMIGEYLWKYTRKTGRGEMSEKRHRRYFWVHPYTRTLYWSDRDPSSAGRAELKTRSVPIDAVRVVTDDNPMPPGLHRKSLVVIAPGRTVKFTCTTGQRHETWFNALSYLLLRTNEGTTDTEDVAETFTREDVDEFNPQFGRTHNTNGSNRHPRAPASLSSYHSQSVRNESPADNMSMNIPTLTPSGAARGSASGNSKSGGGTFSKLSARFRSSGAGLSGTFQSARGRRTPSTQDMSIYEASEVRDSAEDLREMIERQDRESDRLENVRACCDGKHDVGSLPYQSSRRGRHSHAHPAQSTTPTPMASTRSRA